MSGVETVGAWSALLFCGWLAAVVSGVAGFGGAFLLLPALAFVVEGKSVVPILTVAQLLGNLSRAGFGWRDVRWRPVGLFCLGAVPASFAGARVFIGLSTPLALRLVGALLLLVVVVRRTRLRRRTPEPLLAPLGAGIGFVSAVAGSAGPLGAAVFLGLELPAPAYVASEAATAVVMHLVKSVVYQRYSALNLDDLLRGVLLGGALVLGSWTGRRIVRRTPERRFAALVEALLLVSAAVLLIRGR